MSDENANESAVPSFKDRLAMFNKQASPPAGPPLPKPKPREWKRPAPASSDNAPPAPSPGPDAAQPTPPPQPKPSNTHEGSSEHPTRDFSATDAKASISQGGGSLKERMAKLQGLNPVATSPGTGGRTNLRPWEAHKSPSSENAPESAEDAAGEPSQDPTSPKLDSTAASASNEGGGDKSPVQDPSDSVQPEQGIKVGSGGPSAPLAVPRRAGPPRRRPQAAKSPSSTSTDAPSPQSATAQTASADPDPQESAHAAAADDIAPSEEAAHPTEVPQQERETLTSPAPVAATERPEAEEGMAKKEMPISGLDEQPEHTRPKDEPAQEPGTPVEPEADEDEAARKRRLTEKMASMGGQRLGMFPVPPAPTQTAEDEEESAQKEDTLDAEDTNDDTAALDEPKVAKSENEEPQTEDAHSTSPPRPQQTAEETSEAEPVAPSPDSKPQLPQLPPQFAKDADDSDEEQENDAEWDEEPSSTAAPPPTEAPPPLPPSRPPPPPPSQPAETTTADVAEEEAMEKDVPQAEELTSAPEPEPSISSSSQDLPQESEPALRAPPAAPSTAPPPLPAGRPMEAPPVNSEGEEGQEQEESDMPLEQSREPLEESPAEPAASEAPQPPPRRESVVSVSDAPVSKKPTLGLDTKSAPSDPSSVASPSSPIVESRRTSVNRPKIPPPFSPKLESDEPSTGPPLSPRASVSSRRESIMVDSPPLSPRQSQSESRPVSIIQAVDPATRRDSIPQSPSQETAPAPEASQGGQEEGAAEVSEEQEEANRRQRIAERMRKLGGQKFGMFGMPMPGGAKPPSRQASTASTGEPEPPTSPRSAEPREDEAEPAPPLEKRKSEGGMPKGGVALAGIVPPKPQTFTDEPEDVKEQEVEVESTKEVEPVQEVQSFAETPEEEDSAPQPVSKSLGSPPPLPSARPGGLAIETSGAPVESLPSSPQEKSVASPTVPARPSGGHVSSPPPSAGAERLSFISFDDRKQSLDLADPRQSPSAPSQEVEPQSPQVSRAPTSGSVQDSSVPPPVSESAAASSLDGYTSTELVTISERYGAQVFAKAKSKSRDGTRWSGENPSHAFVSAVLAEISDLEQPKSKGEFGQCIYRISSPNMPMPSPDTIRIGDIVVVKQAKLRAKIGSTSLGMGSTPFAAIIEDYDPKKHKVHYLEASKSGKIESGGFHLDHIKEGTIEIQRAVPART